MWLNRAHVIVLKLLSTIIAAADYNEEDEECVQIEVAMIAGVGYVASTADHRCSDGTPVWSPDCSLNQCCRIGGKLNGWILRGTGVAVMPELGAHPWSAIIYNSSTIKCWGPVWYPQCVVEPFSDYCGGGRRKRNSKVTINLKGASRAPVTRPIQQPKNDMDVKHSASPDHNDARYKRHWIKQKRSSKH